METDQFYTSEQRVRRSLSHREPDRVPFDLGATGVTGIHSPLEAAENVEKVERHPWPGPEETTRRIEELAPGGGFVFSAVHNIQADVPPENIMAMWETLQEYRA